MGHASHAKSLHRCESRSHREHARTPAQTEARSFPHSASTRCCRSKTTPCAIEAAGVERRLGGCAGAASISKRIRATCPALNEEPRPKPGFSNDAHDALARMNDQHGAFSTVVNALMMPVPIVPGGGPRGGNGVIHVLISDSICPGVQSTPGFDCIIATKPATCGDDIEVPLR